MSLLLMPPAVASQWPDVHLFIPLVHPPPPPEQLIVGYDFTGPVPYWIVRNSWGTWGNAGYVYVEATDDGIGACRMYSGLMQPLTTSSAYNPTPSPSPSPTPSPSPSPSPSPKPSPAPKPCKGKKC